VSFVFAPDSVVGPVRTRSAEDAISGDDHRLTAGGICPPLVVPAGYFAVYNLAVQRTMTFIAGIYRDRVENC
jgi:hypothetical protein